MHAAVKEGVRTTDWSAGVSFCARQMLIITQNDPRASRHRTIKQERCLARPCANVRALQIEF